MIEALQELVETIEDILVYVPITSRPPILERMEKARNFLREYRKEADTDWPGTKTIKKRMEGK